MAAALITKLIKDGIGGLLPRRLLDAAGDGTGPFVAITIPGKADGTGVVDIEGLSADQVAAINAITATIDNGVPITAAALPLPAGAATDSALASILAKITNDPATQTTLSAINTKLGAALPLPTGASTAAQIGEVQSSPTANTVLDRLKTIATGLGSVVLAAGTAVIGKVALQVGGSDVSATNPVPVGSAQIATVTATIASGGSLSGAADLGTGRIVGLIMPAAWTTASVTFQASADGTNFFDLYDLGAERAIASSDAIAAHFVALPLTDWLGIRAVKVRSGSTGSAVNQSADRIITLVTAR